MVFLASTKEGFHLKEQVKFWCLQWQLQVEDLGSASADEEMGTVSLAEKLAEKVAGHYDDSVGIIISGIGIDVDIVCNRSGKIRSGLALIADQARKARENLDINVLALASDYTSFKRAKKIVAEFFKREFCG
ncbi:MAG: RpiB/LacA/LacB family sugar-phosphate isomerase [Patescibacteria group bacterium]|nr:RpiB/LacA/LacB family sugar-phosphate isomerase [Patescibacteria group bacterium]